MTSTQSGRATARNSSSSGGSTASASIGSTSSFEWIRSHRDYEGAAPRHRQLRLLAGRPSGHLRVGLRDPVDDLLANVDGSGVRTLELGMSATHPALRPPDGEVAFTGSPSDDAQDHRHLRRQHGWQPDAHARRTARDAAAGEPQWSPDGSIAYGLVDFNVTEWTSHTRVMADGAVTEPADAGRCTVQLQRGLVERRDATRHAAPDMRRR